MWPDETDTSQKIPNTGSENLSPFNDPLRDKLTCQNNTKGTLVTTIEPQPQNSGKVARNNCE